MKLYICYAKPDQALCPQIQHALDVHEVWYDDYVQPGRHRGQAILERLRWCEGFIYLLSPESVVSERCQQQLKMAQHLQRAIIPVIIKPNTPIPPALRDIQAVDISGGLTVDGIGRLFNAIHRLEMQQAVGNPQTVRQSERANGGNGYAVLYDVQDYNGGDIQGHSIELLQPDPLMAVQQAADAMSRGDFEQAVTLLRQARAAGGGIQFINLDALLQEAEEALHQQVFQREVEREYATIVALVRQRRTYRVGREAFRAFRTSHPEYDPQNLAALCDPPELPLLEWREIPAGKVIIERGRKRTVYEVDAFGISKYPVTNAQYQVFIEAEDGYRDDRWWEYSAAALRWHSDNREPLPVRFPGDAQPRTNVCWYEAVAFCLWLSHRTDLKITLPTEHQWQRAAQGDSQRPYPWGRRFDPSLCNTRESRLGMTTPVNRYSHSASPYGVYDLVGNTWEWCATWQRLGENGAAGQETGRVVRGGAFVSPHDRANNFSYFVLKEIYRYHTIGFRLAVALA